MAGAIRFLLLINTGFPRAKRADMLMHTATGAGTKQRVQLSPLPLFDAAHPHRQALHSGSSVREDRTTQSPLRPTHIRDVHQRGERVFCADTQTDMLAGLPASTTCVQRFDDSRVLQFTLRIAFRCVLHRCGSQDILRHEFYFLVFQIPLVVFGFGF
jgi:hypothetical protein